MSMKPTAPLTMASLNSLWLAWILLFCENLWRWSFASALMTL
jgi:hypothetical protein